MTRNLLLLFSTLAVVGLLFLGYWYLVDDPADRGPERRAEPDTFAARPGSPGAPTLHIANAAEVPSGGGIEITIYDPRTGRPTQHFQCEEWTPVPDTEDEIHVTRPQLTLRLPGALGATVSAAEGRITVDRIEKAQPRPKQGMLRGNVRIVVTRDARHSADATDQGPAEVASVTLDDLSFNLETGALHTSGALQVAGAQFELFGAGLDVVWNQADNVIESLLLREGRELVLRGGGPFQAAAPATTGAPTGVAAAMPPTATRPDRRSAGQRRAAAYACVLTDHVAAEQFEGDESVGQLTADEIRLLVDIFAAERLAPESAPSTPTTEPATQMTRSRLVVHWNGPLRLEPQAAASGSEPRRHFEARGNPVTLTHADSSARCGQLEYFDETQQLWLHPVTDGRVDFAVGAGLTASADSVYIDQASHVAKLIGDVRLTSKRGKQPSSHTQSIRCALWAELTLVPPTRTPADGDLPTSARTDPLRFGQIRAAAFVGDAVVDLADQTLAAQRIDAIFRPASDERSLEAALESAVATGSVRLTRGHEAVECERLDLAFALSPDGELYPRRMDARGSVVIARDRAWIAGDQIVAEIDPAPAARRPEEPLFLLRTLDVLGDAELRDPRNKVAARGQTISATFAANNRLSKGTVRGSPGVPGMVHASPYTVRGGQIDLEWESQALHVEGPGWLSFKTRRGLEGQQRAEPLPVVVTAQQSLHIDGRRNTVHFAGEVVAASGEEQLRGDTLTLLLEDVERTPATQAAAPGVADLLREARQIFAQRQAGKPQDEFLDLRPAESERLRKEPVRLMAENALVLSESYEAGDAQPIVHSSIAAPSLEVDIVHREITTRGRTTLLLTSRRLDSDSASQREPFGIPSGLLTRGPSQTAMQCERGMTYALGPEGPSRRDSVLFEGDVVFVHRAGRDMVNLEQMLPQVRTNPELVANLQSRNTSLQCDRLEVGFLVENSGSGEGAAVSGRGAIRLTWLLASGRPYLRDVQGSVIRSIHAAQLDFDRLAGLIRVLGTPQTQARIYEEDAAEQNSRVLVGEEFLIDLRDGRVHSGAAKGEFREQ